MTLFPLPLKMANTFVELYHRHHKPTPGHKFSLGAVKDHQLVGVLIAGRPVSRHLDDGLLLEVNRCCTDGTRNACSFLYGAATRVAREMGYHKIITYTLPSEGGASLRGLGWRKVMLTGGGTWNCSVRSREDDQPLDSKWRWECCLRQCACHPELPKIS